MTVASGQTFPVNVGIDILDLGSRGNAFPDRIEDGALPKDRADGGPVLRHLGLRLREPRVPDGHSQGIVLRSGELVPEAAARRRGSAGRLLAAQEVP